MAQQPNRATGRETSEPKLGEQDVVRPDEVTGSGSSSLRWLVPLTVAAAALAWILGQFAVHAPGLASVLLLAAGAVCTGVATGAPLWQQYRTRRAMADAVATALAARSAMRMALADALDPFVHLIAQLTQARGAETTRLHGEAIQLAVTTIASLAGSSRVRVCYCALEEAGQSVQLRPVQFAGRAGAPTVTFTAQSEQGQAALALADGNAWSYVADTNIEPPPCWWDDESAYTTMLAGPVSANEQPHGLLTLDALEPGELARVDGALVRLLATLLATALAVE